MKSWWGKDTDKNISAPSLTLLIFAVGWVCSTTTQTRLSNATAIVFSVKCFNSLKLYPLSGNIFRKWFASYFLLFKSMWSPTVPHRSHVIKSYFLNIRWPKAAVLKIAFLVINHQPIVRFQRHFAKWTWNSMACRQRPHDKNCQFR